MKKNPESGQERYSELRKFFRVMKLCLCILLGAMLSVSANSLAQRVKMSLEKQNADVMAVLSEVCKKNGFQLLCNDDELRGMRTTIAVKDASLEEILDHIFKDTALGYRLVDDVVVVVPKKDQRGESTLPQQTGIEVKGTVRDEDGNPLPGVSVLISGTSVGVATDVNGEFTIRVPNLKTKLVFAFLGMDTEVVEVKKNTLEVILKEKQNDLDEVVVVGYGSARKKDLTGSVFRVDPKLFEESAATDIAQIIQGQVPGLSILTGSGRPGESAQLRIRGLATLRGNAGPLIVLDDVPMPSNFAINTLNPSDVQSIDVLKDASATAIYGSRAAGGVVIITTKRGGQKDPSISYGYTCGWQQLTTDLRSLSPDEYKMLLFEACKNSAIAENYQSLEDYEMYKTITSPGFFGEENTNWMKLMMQNAFKQNHDLSIRGGSKAAQYYISMGYSQDKGVVKNSIFNRYNAMANLDLTISKYIKSGISFRLDCSDRTNSSVTMDKIAEARPDIAAYNEDGSYHLQHYVDGRGTDQWLDNPMINLDRENGSQDKTLSLSANLDFAITADLLLKFKASYNYSNTESRSYDPSTTSAGSNYFKGQLGSLNQGFGHNQSYMVEGQLSFAKTVNNHAFDAVGVITYNDREGISNSFVFTDFPDDSKQTALWQAANYKSNSGNESNSLLFSTVIRGSYRYHGRYLLTASARMDISSNFAEEHRRGFFPSIGIGWVTSEEKFMKSLKSWLPYLKFRGSMGKTGITAGGSTESMNVFKNDKYMNLPTVIPYQLGNPDLTWETTMQYDVAMEFGFLKNSKFRGSIGWYRKDTDHLLNQITLPPSTGMDRVNVNMASSRNTGIEFEISTTLVRYKHFSWNLSLNVSKNTNIITGLDKEMTSSLSGGTDLDNTILQEAKTVGLFYGYKTAGIIRTKEEIDALNAGAPKGMTYQNGKESSDRPSIPGDIKYVDMNGDGFVDFTNIRTSEDRTVLGSSNPDFTGGFNTSFSYKNLNLGIHGTFSYGGKKYWAALPQQFTMSASTPKNVLNVALERWTPENPNARYPQIRVNNTNISYFSDFFLYDASFLKIQNISLSYRLPNAILKRMPIFSDISFSASVNNPFVFTPYPGPNPESYSTNKISGSAVDNSLFPEFMTINFGIRIQLN